MNRRTIIRRWNLLRSSVSQKLVAFSQGEDIGSLFWTARMAAGLSLSDVAKRTGEDIVDIYNYECGMQIPPNGWRVLFEKLVHEKLPPQVIADAVKAERNAVIQHLRSHAKGFFVAGYHNEARVLEEKLQQIIRGDHLEK